MIAKVRGEEAQGAAVNLEMLDGENLQAVPREERLQRGEGEVEDVLVVDGVELGVLDEVHAVRTLENDATAGAQEAREPGDEVIGGRRVGEDVVAENEIGLTIFGGETGGEVCAEEFDERFDAFLASDFSDVGGGFDAETGHAEADEILQQIAVIAGDLDDAAGRAEGEFLHVALCRGAGVPEQGVGEGREVEVIGEEIDGRGEVRDLKQPAACTDGDTERKARLGFSQISREKEVICQGLMAEIEDEMTLGVAAGKAAEIHGVGSKAGKVG